MTATEEASLAERWSARVSTGCFVVAGALLVLAGLVEGEAVTWAELGRQAGRFPWLAAVFVAAGVMLLAVPAVLRHRGRPRLTGSKPPMAALRWSLIIPAAAVVVIAAAWAGTVWLLSVVDQAGAATSQDRISAIRTGLSVGVGAAGAITLALAARRQWLGEIGHAQQEKVAAATEHDAAERRITELYSKAVEQLGSDKAPVRLGGLYALERLAEDTPKHRQTIINVLCAYLRMAPPDPPPAGDDATAEQKFEIEAALRRAEEEHHVRLTAQEILTRHLVPGDAALFWHGSSLNLAKAHLSDFILSNGELAGAVFTGAVFAGQTNFERTTFTQAGEFAGATFAGETSFNEAMFEAHATFHLAKFGARATFNSTTFNSYAVFVGTKFSGMAWFFEAKFVGTALFGAVQFRDRELRLTNARVAKVTAGHAWPDGWAAEPDPAQPGQGHLAEHALPLPAIVPGQPPGAGSPATGR